MKDVVRLSGREMKVSESAGVGTLVRKEGVVCWLSLDVGLCRD